MIKPTTTLFAETANNTSAPDSISTLTNSHAPVGNVSKVPVRSLLYPGSDTKVFTAIMGWFGKSSHISVGYQSDDPAQVRKQVEDMTSRGFDGTILTWYGQGGTKENNAALLLKSEAERHPGFNFVIMVDHGSLVWYSNGQSPTDALIRHLNYAATTFYASPAYLRIDGRPVVMEFGLEAHPIDWARVRSSIQGNPIIIFRNAGGWLKPFSDGAYAWGPAQSTMSYLDSFNQQSFNYPTLQTFGGISPGFDDSLASWGQQRYVDRRCGQRWLETFAVQRKWFSTAKPLKYLQVATWNDYEEGSTIESGIDNCLSVSASVAENILSWSLAGAGLENTIDHYTVFISTDGENLMSLAEIPIGTYSLDLSTYQLPGGTYTLYVKAVGKPSILNKISNAVSFFTNKPPVAALAVMASSAYAPSSVNITVEGSYDPDGNIASASIDFGDGTLSTGLTATHVYKSAGIYSITATLTDNSGATSATSSVVQVQPASVNILQPLTVGTLLSSPVRVEAQTLSGIPIDGMWVYVDSKSVHSVKGGSFTADIVMAPGTHKLLVKAWDIQGNVIQTSRQVSIINNPPAPKLTLSATSGVAPFNVTASTSGSADSDGTIVSSTIDFGDGAISTGTSVAHLYSVPGTYSVKATITDNNGATATAYALVTVLAPGVVITSPIANSTSPQSIRISAYVRSSNKIASMIVYVDGVRRYTMYSDHLDTYLSMLKGAHSVLVKAWEDGTGKTYQSSLKVNIQ